MALEALLPLLRFTETDAQFHVWCCTHYYNSTLQKPCTCTNTSSKNEYLEKNPQTAGKVSLCCMLCLEDCGAPSVTVPFSFPSSALQTSSSSSWLECDVRFDHTGQHCVLINYQSLLLFRLVKTSSLYTLNDGSDIPVTHFVMQIMKLAVVLLKWSADKNFLVMCRN